MNANILLLFLCVVFYVTKVNAKQRSLKIVIPSKIRYVHHHHTHVLVMKDKKAYKEPEAKFHHLHYYQPGGRRGKDPYHYLVPFPPPQDDDEVEDESVPEYAVAPPRRGHFHQQPIREYIPTRQPVSVHEEPEYYTPPRKFRTRDRNDFSSKGYRSFYPYENNEYEKSVAKASELRYKIEPVYTDGDMFDNSAPLYSDNRWKIKTKYNY